MTADPAEGEAQRFLGAAYVACMGIMARKTGLSFEEVEEIIKRNELGKRHSKEVGDLYSHFMADMGRAITQEKARRN